ncbi:MAG: citrate synthase [Eubacteriales bacterium]
MTFYDLKETDFEQNNSAERQAEDRFYKKQVEILKNTDLIKDELYVQKDVKRGLRNADGTGVVVGLTRVGQVIGYDYDTNGNKIPTEGKLYYRGYDVEDLVKNVNSENRFGFEEATYLLLFGKLPTRVQLTEFCEILGSKRELPGNFARDMIMTAPSRNIMNKLARSVLAMYSYDPNPDDTSLENVLRQSIRLIGSFPAFISYGFQAKRAAYDKKSLHFYTPIPSISTAENILRMIRKTGQYTDLEAKLLDLSLILHAEHGGGNNSSFTTHLVSSTGTDTYGAIASAVSSLKGPRHGGANLAVINMIDDLKENVKDITDYKKVEEYLIKVLKGEANDRSGLIYGLGHAVYTLSDPRAVMLKKMAKKLADQSGMQEQFALYEFIEKKGAQLYCDVKGVCKPMPANVDLYSGFVYKALNIPIEIATPLFATARLSGWCAHRLEELSEGSKIMRPAYESAQNHQEYVPIDKR